MSVPTPPPPKRSATKASNRSTSASTPTTPGSSLSLTTPARTKRPVQVGQPAGRQPARRSSPRAGCLAVTRDPLAAQPPAATASAIHVVRQQAVGSAAGGAGSPAGVLTQGSQPPGARRHPSGAAGAPVSRSPREKRPPASAALIAGCWSVWSDARRRRTLIVLPPATDGAPMTIPSPFPSPEPLPPDPLPPDPREPPSPRPGPSPTDPSAPPPM